MVEVLVTMHTHRRKVYCILASCYIRLTRNICSFVCYIDGQKNKYSGKKSISRTMVATRPKVFYQMAAPVPEIMDGSLYIVPTY
jgi:hypothetical protein